MIVKGELTEAQVEVRETTAEILSSPGKISRLLYSLEDSSLWINNGSSWKKLLQKENQFKDFPVGSVQVSFLNLASFQLEIAFMKNVNVADTTWILCDGQDISGSDYATVSGSNFAPDARGLSIRMKDHSSGLNPDGDLALGSYQADMLASHSHIETYSAGGQFNDFINTPKVVGRNDLENGSNFTSQNSTLASGGNETRGKSITANYFIKINRTVL